MRVLAVTFGVVALALGAAAFAPASQQAVSPAQFNALKKRVTAAERRVADLETIVVNCLAYDVAPVAKYGDGTSEGYAYLFADGRATLTSALDLIEPGHTPHYSLLAVEPSCAAVIDAPLVSLAQRALRVQRSTAKTGPRAVMPQKRTP